MSSFYTEVLKSPLRPRALRELSDFAARQGIAFEPGDCTVCVRTSEGALAATGTLRGRVLQCVAVDAALRGEGLTARVMTALHECAFARGERHLFLFTKPGNEGMFREFGFYPVSHTSAMLLMENRRGGAAAFAASLEHGPQGGVHGAVVANCNPFTNGHRRLVEYAAGACDTLHLFILSEEGSEVPAAARFALAQQGVRDLENVIVHPTSDYLVSSVTFPTYFLKDSASPDAEAGKLDLAVFCDYFVPELCITRRFVGAEPLCRVTAAYNALMRELLPPRGVQVTEIPRLACGGEVVSASRVRRLWKQKRWDDIAPLVPESTLRFLRSCPVDEKKDPL